MKTLLLMRHAKAASEDAGLSDEQRPLTHRGQQDAPRMGRFLLQEGFVPDHVVTSSAVRASATAQLIAQECCCTAITVLPELYHADVHQWQQIVWSFSPGWNSVLCVGHNPELEEVSGFDALKRVGSLMILKNGVTRISGFERLESADLICISNNSRLIYLSGLKQLMLVDDLVLESNPRLAPLPHMLPNLAHVGGDLRLSGSPGVDREHLLGPELGARMEVASR